MSDLKTTLYARLEAIAGAEKVTRTELAAFSRESLDYVLETHDIDLINRLIGVLTPVNKRAAILFFGHFLPWVQEKDTDGKFTRFGGMVKGDKKVAKKVAAIKEFLAVPENTIWTWADNNIEMKQLDLVAPIARAINAALKGNEKRDADPIPAAEVVAAIFASDLSFADMVAGVEAQQKLAQIAADQVTSQKDEVADAE